MFKNKNCIVTGGAGFIGQHLMRRLIKEGANIVMVDSFFFNNKNEIKKYKVEIVEADIRSKNLWTKLPKKKYHYLFHLAAPSTTALFENDFSGSCDITIAGYLNAIEYAFEKDIRFIYATSGSLYSGIHPPHKENSILRFERLNTYAKNKWMTEKIAKIYEEKFPTLGLRILAGYGPGEEHKKQYASVVYSFCKTIFQNKRPAIWGDGNQRRDFIFIEDIIDVMLHLGDSSCDEPIVNVGTGVDISFNKLITLINSLVGSNIRPTYKDKPTNYLTQTIADISLLRKYYKRPFTSIHEGIQKTIESFRNLK